jgi:UDP-N-acetylglucosamine transferase subunit ALG13
VVGHIRAARVVVTHAGAGSVLTCLAAGTRPIVIPRLRRYGETSDDHQLAFGRRLDEVGLVTLVEDLRLLADVVGAASANPVVQRPVHDRLADDLRAYFETAVGERRSPARSQ